MILYLHGFRSSPLSYKAKLMGAALAERGLAELWVCPQLPASPAAAIAMATHLIEQAQAQGVNISQDLVIVGSSLGGYYATNLAEHWKCRAVVLNPAVYAANSLATQVGEHTQYHSDAAFVFLPEYIDELAEIATGKPAHPERYYLLACKGDEVLDWQDMANWYAGSQGRILEGGDHGISDFERWLPEVLEFALATPSTP
ncbi:MAG: alpha/beta fold hydrolase [Burkholderiaceae bacterium]|nr:alpha/beta fold hydrolase [Burkholderiaceae bacterium]